MYSKKGKAIFQNEIKSKISRLNHIFKQFHKYSANI